jgi:hypothetical protein
MNIGDCVASNVCPTMIGKISQILNDNCAMVECSGVEILTDLSFWHKVILMTN